MRIIRLMAASAAVCAVSCAVAAAQPPSQKLWELRNLGKAFYENPDTHLQEVAQLRTALQLAPDSVRERINFGLALLRAGQTADGVAELVRAQKQDPALAGAGPVEPRREPLELGVASYEVRHAASLSGHEALLVGERRRFAAARHVQLAEDV